MNLKPRRIVILLLAIAAVATAGYFLTRPKPVEVSVIAVARGVVESTVANTRAGTVKACRRAKLSPAVGGQVARLLVKEGDTVRAGQVLLEIWNKDLAARVTLAESEATANRALVEEACLAADIAEREAKRTVRLEEKGIVAEENVDRAVTGAKGRAASCRAARARLDVSEDNVAVATTALERTILRAPFPGYVAELSSELGEYVTPSPPGIPTPPAVDLVDTSCLYIEAPIDEVDAPAISPGMEARITLDAFSGRSFKGTVRRIAPYVFEIEKQARTVDVEAAFLDPGETADLLPGYSADLEILLERHENVLRISTDAILEGGRVIVRRKDGVLEEREIGVGLSNWRHTEIVSGLDEGESVVTTIHREGVRAGAPSRLESPTPD